MLDSAMMIQHGKKTKPKNVYDNACVLFIAFALWGMAASSVGEATSVQVFVVHVHLPFRPTLDFSRGVR